MECPSSCNFVWSFGGFVWKSTNGRLNMGVTQPWKSTVFLLHPVCKCMSMHFFAALILRPKPSITPFTSLYPPSNKIDEI